MHSEKIKDSSSRAAQENILEPFFKEFRAFIKGVMETPLTFIARTEWLRKGSKIQLLQSLQGKNFIWTAEIQDKTNLILRLNRF